jgi:hypothetical protein
MHEPYAPRVDAGSNGTDDVKLLLENEKMSRA